MTDDENDELYADEIEADRLYYDRLNFTDEYQRKMYDFGLKESDFG